MSSTQNVGNNVGAVNDFQLNNTAPYGAHGERKVQQNLNPSTNALACTTSDRMNQLQSGKKVPISQLATSVTSLGNASKTDGSEASNQVAQNNILKVQNTFAELLNQSNISSEAKAVYMAALGILSEVSKCEDFSATNIQKAISIGLNYARNTTSLKGTVDFFNEDNDGGAYNYDNKKQKKATNGFPKPKIEECYLICNNLGFKTNEEVKHPQNPCELKIDLESCQEANTEKTYKFKDGNGKEVPNLKITCPKDFNIESYSGQLQREVI